MEADHFRLQLLDHFAHRRIERRAIGGIDRRRRVEPELLIIRPEPLLPSGLARGIGIDRLVAEEIHVDRRRDALADDVDLLARLLRREHRARQRAQRAALRRRDHESASMTPAIGASTIGNSVLKSSRSRRSGHMVCSFVRMDWREHGNMHRRSDTGCALASQGPGGVAPSEQYLLCLGRQSARRSRPPAECRGSARRLRRQSRRRYRNCRRPSPPHIRRRPRSRFAAVRASRPDPAARMIVDQAASGERRRPHIVARQVEDDAARRCCRFWRRRSVSWPPRRRRASTLA